MNRRQMMMFPGVAAAAAAGQSLANAQSSLPPIPSSGTVAKYGTSKATYKIPKTETAKTKYENFLNTLLGLSASQQQQIDAILTAAILNRNELHGRLKTARQSLAQAVVGSNSSAIGQLTGSIGSLTGQVRSNAATANAGIYQVLTANQQATLAQFQS
jgi:Spy/CpxP family protein refolding chaperone